MPADKDQLRTEIRRKIAAWPLRKPTVSGTLSASATTVTLNSTSGIAQRLLLEVDSEIMLILDVPSATTLTVLRGHFGTTAAAHSSGAICSIFPPYGWTNIEVNEGIRHAIQWLKNEPFPSWTHKFFTGTWPANQASVSISDTIASWPRGEGLVFSLYIKGSADGDPTRFLRLDNWQQRQNSITIPSPFPEDKTFRIEVARFQPQLPNETEELDSDDYEIPMVLYASYWLLKSLQGNRVHFVEYSAALNERASTPDELLRTIFDFKNQADLAKRDIYQPIPKRISKWKGGYVS
jgi:hypothetical protein